MEKNNKISPLRLAICIVSIVFLVIWIILHSVEHLTFSYSVVPFLIYVIGTVVAAYLDNKYVLLSFPLGLIVWSLLYGWHPVWPVLGGIIILACIIIWIIPRSKTAIYRYLWIMAVVLLFAYLIIDVADSIDSELFYYAKAAAWFFLIRSLYNVVITTLVGIWMYSSGRPLNQIGPIDTKPENDSVSDKIIRLNVAKDLLDSGVITKKEFDLKKTQIMGNPNEGDIDLSNSNAMAGAQALVENQLDEATKGSINALKSLLDSGFLTQEEFDDKKRQMLDQ